MLLTLDLINLLFTVSVAVKKPVLRRGSREKSSSVCAEEVGREVEQLVSTSVFTNYK